jgi:hypothetical protein
MEQYKFAPGEGHFAIPDSTRLKLNRRTVLKSSLALLAVGAAGPISSAELEITM